MAKLGMLSPEGLCKTFDAAANGFVRAKAAASSSSGLWSDALRDNDRIYAVIRGTAVNQDGRSNVLTAPNGLAQQNVIRAALAKRSFLPLPSLMLKRTAPAPPSAIPSKFKPSPLSLTKNACGDLCVLGAVKSNLGHLEAAAGVAGLYQDRLGLSTGNSAPSPLSADESPHRLEKSRC